MAWEIRGGRRYYYRSVRKDGRVRRVYQGTGSTGDFVATLDLERCQAERQLQEARRDLTRHLDELSGLTEHLCGTGRMLAAVAFHLAGFYRHDRHAWKRRKTHGK